MFFECLFFYRTDILIYLFFQEAFDLESVTQSMKSFVEKVSSHEGAEFPWCVSGLVRASE